MDELPRSRVKLSAHIDNCNFQPREPSAFPVDESLLTRIRSLLLSRNFTYPPHTPCPTPQFSASATIPLDNHPRFKADPSPGLGAYGHVKRHITPRRSSRMMSGDLSDSDTAWRQDETKRGFDPFESISLKDRDEDSEVWSTFLSLDQEAFERSIALDQIPVSKFISDYVYAKSMNRTPIGPQTPDLRSVGRGFPEIMVRDDGTPKSSLPTIASVDPVPAYVSQESRTTADSTYLDDSLHEKSAKGRLYNTPEPTSDSGGGYFIEHPSAIVAPLDFKKKTNMADGPRADPPSPLALESDLDEPIDSRIHANSVIRTANDEQISEYGGPDSRERNGSDGYDPEPSNRSATADSNYSLVHGNSGSGQNNEIAAVDLNSNDLRQQSLALPEVDKDNKHDNSRHIASSCETMGSSKLYMTMQQTPPPPYSKRKGRDALESQLNHSPSGPTTQPRSQSRASASKHLFPSPHIVAINPSTLSAKDQNHESTPAHDDECRQFAKLKATRALTSPSCFGSSIQNELYEVLKRVKRSNTAVLGSRDDENSDSDTPTAWDLQTAKVWITQLVKHSLGREQSLQDNDRNLTSRPLRKSKSYFDQYATSRASLKSDGILSVDGRSSGMTSGEIESHAERFLLSLKSESLERVIKELETVIGDALEKAAKTSDEYEPSIYKELQDIANCLQPTDNPFHRDDTTVDDVAGREVDISESSKPSNKETVPVARMNRIIKENSDTRLEESRLRTNEYHRALLRMYDEKIRPKIFPDRAESQQRAEALKDSAIPDFLRQSSINTVDTEKTESTSHSSFQPSFPMRSESGYESQKSVPLMFAAEHSRRETEQVLSRSQEPQGLRIRRSRTTEFKKRSSSRVPTNRMSDNESMMSTDKFRPQAIGVHDFAISPLLDALKANEIVTHPRPPARRAPDVPPLKRQASVADPVKKHSSAGSHPSKTVYRVSSEILSNGSRPSKKDLLNYMKKHSQPPVMPRESSVRRRSVKPDDTEQIAHKGSGLSQSLDLELGENDVDYVAEFDSGKNTTAAGVNGLQAYSTGTGDFAPQTLPDKESGDVKTTDIPLNEYPRVPNRRRTKITESDLHGHRHLSLRGFRAGFSLHKSHKRAPIARDWSNRRKRFVAMIACVSTALVGIMIGIYAGEAPALQYSLVDEHHRFIYLGNVLLYLGLALSNIMFWPLPILHGRKPYTLSSLVVLLPLLFPQAMSVMVQRTSSDALARIGLLAPRFLGGFALGFANINFFGVLLDVFGASLMSSNPHKEVVNEHDARRHGGGMGVWLGIWTWCYMGSIGTGFFVGAMITGNLNVTWGFWICIFITIFAILLNVIAPETRRSAYRRSMAEVRSGTDVSRRIARGEIMMHLYSTGPKHWYQEMVAGWVLSLRMIRQPGFLILAVYQAWIYGQVVMVMILLGALTSKYYHLQAWQVALCVAAFPLGALVAIPFQKASFFSRARHHPQRTDSMTFQRRVVWTSHMVRRTLFMVSLPLAGVAYTLVSRGPPSTPLPLPILFAALIGLLSNLALSECQGLMMECFDTSDLQPGMTGRQRNPEALSESERATRTNFSCFPRVTAAFALVQSLSFAVAAAATAWGGNVERSIGAQAATGAVAAVLGLLTVLLFAALARVRNVQVVPSGRVPTAVLSGPGKELPVIIGSPSGTERRVSLLEMGRMTRWTEIRRRNKLL